MRGGLLTRLTQETQLRVAFLQPANLLTERATEPGQAGRGERHGGGGTAAGGGVAAGDSGNIPGQVGVL